MSKITAARLKRLEAARQDYGPQSARQTENLLASFTNLRFADPATLIAFHDAILFLRAFPQSERVAKLADDLLSKMEAEVARLRQSGADMDEFDDERVSGIAGSVLRYEHTYEVARWLAKLYPNQVAAEWDPDEQYGKLVNAVPRFLPLLEDDSFVEPDIPFMKWMANAAGIEGKEWLWLMSQFEEMQASLQDKTELYDALGLVLEWDLAKSPASRTYARRKIAKLFAHGTPLLQRKQVSLANELASPDIPLAKLSRAEAEPLLQQAREALTVRHRELYGTTRADADYVYRADVGRGVEIYLWGLPPDRRLPLRAYHAGCTFKNGVPINYLESISLADWAEVGFNTFYTYRNGETAWIYSKVLHILHQHTGVSCISVYPYQIGFENEEAIESGAFWFYRKLGFRPGRPELLALTLREEKKLARDPKYRTSAATLRKLATGHMFYEFANAPHGLYDSFRTRHIGLAVQNAMAKNYDGSRKKMRKATSDSLAKALGVALDRWSNPGRDNFANFAYVLALIPDIASWTSEEKGLAVDAIRAKAGLEEGDYLRILQKHDRLKRDLVRLGSLTA